MSESQPWRCSECSKLNPSKARACLKCGVTYEHSRAIELRKQAEAQCERMRKNWLDEKQRREAAELRAWELEHELNNIKAAPRPVANDRTTPDV